MKFAHVFAAAAALAVSLLAACAPADDEAFVARWNGISVTSQRFADEYRRFATVAPGRDDLQARRSYALRMIERAVLADRARSLHMDTLGPVRAYTERAADMAVRRAWLEGTIGDTIPAPLEHEVRQAFERSITRLRLRQIYAATKAEADRIVAELAAGVPFDSLAARSMRLRGIETESVAGDMGWITFGDLDEAPEEIVFGLAQGDVSAPVASLQGWHVFRLLEREETVRIDATAYQSARERIAFEVRQRRFDEASARHIRSLVVSRDLVTDLGVLGDVWEAIFPALEAFDPSAPVIALDRELSASLETGLTESTPVARVEARAFTVGRLLQGLPDVPRPFWRDPRASLEVAIRDSLLAAHARSLGFERERSVERRRKVAEDEILYQALLFAVADSLDMRRIADTFYRDYRDRYFVRRFVTTYDRRPFADSARARQALDSLWVRSRGQDDSLQWSGPYRDGDDWSLTAVTGRTPQYVPEDSVDIAPYLQAALFEIVHRAALGPLFDPRRVELDDERLMTALPVH